jgi:hypothetical protein
MEDYVGLYFSMYPPCEGWVGLVTKGIQVPIAHVSTCMGYCRREERVGMPLVSWDSFRLLPRGHCP